MSGSMVQCACMPLNGRTFGWCHTSVRRTHMLADSVEDRILRLQDKKRTMISAAFGEDDSGEAVGLAARLTVEDIQFLFAGL